MQLNRSDTVKSAKMLSFLNISKKSSKYNFEVSKSMRNATLKNCKAGISKPIDKKSPYAIKAKHCVDRIALNAYTYTSPKSSEIDIIGSLVKPNWSTIATEEKINSERFPSNLLAENLQASIISRAKNYESVGISNEELITSEPSLKLADWKNIIECAFKQTIRTIASIAIQKDINRVQISQNESLTEVFEDLFKQYLPPISSEAFCSIEPLLIKDIINELRFKEIDFYCGKVLFENKNIYIYTKKDYVFPGFLNTDNSDFVVATAI